MKAKKLITTATVCAGLVLALPLYARPIGSEVVQQDSLPSVVQKTIKEKAAGGEITQVRREDDANGKWNYEVVVTSNGKEWGFEVNPEGKFLRKHDNLTAAR
ncbi:MAG: PepSY domain-containing protein [Bryobacteraceae bacterium]